MAPDPQIPPFDNDGSVPPRLPASEPPGAGGVPPPLTPDRPRKSSTVRQLVIILLSLYLGLFMVDAVVSLIDESLILFWDINAFTAIRGILFIFVTIMAVGTYGLMALTPMIPKRLFLPVTLFNPAAILVSLPLLIYSYSRIQLVAWVISFAQVIFCLGILHRLQGGFKFRWPLVAESQLAARRFSWPNLLVFLLLNGCVLLPVAVVYLFLCAALAVDHFSEGFAALRPGGLTVPWGVAHLPEVAREIQRSGFRLEKTREHVAIRFRSDGNKGKGARK